MKGATRYVKDDMWAILISIHAPMKGATRYVKDDMWAILISIHAPMKGATGVIVGTKGVLNIFQSTHP